MQDPSSILSTLVIGTIIGAFLLLVSFLARVGPLTRMVYQVKFHPYFTPHISILRPDEDLLPVIGIDAYVVLQFISLAIKIATTSTLFSMVLLVPMYIYGSSKSSSSNFIMLASLSNIDANNPIAYAALIHQYAYVLIFLKLARDHYKNFAYVRQAYLSGLYSSSLEQYRYSILIENIPSGYRSSNALKTLFQRMFPDHLHSVKVMMDTEGLEVSITSRTDILRRLESARARVAPKQCALLQAELDQLNQIVSSKQNTLHMKALAGQEEGSTGFVTFTSIQAALISSSTLLFSQYPGMHVLNAPHPHDIIWSNVRSMNYHSRDDPHLIFSLAYQRTG